MALFNIMPSFNIGPSMYIPGMNPAINLPGGAGRIGLGLPTGSGLPSAALGTPTVTGYTPPPDYRTTYGLTPGWGNINVPLLQQFVNPSPYVKALASVNDTIKNLPPVVPQAEIAASPYPKDMNPGFANPKTIQTTNPTANQYTWGVPGAVPNAGWKSTGPTQPTWMTTPAKSFAPPPVTVKPVAPSVIATKTTGVKK